MQEGVEKEISWSFKTKNLDEPYYIVDSSGETYDVKSAQTYYFYLPPDNCTDTGSGYSVSYSGDVSIETSYLFHDGNVLKIKVTGTNGNVNVHPNNGRDFTLVLSNTDDAIYPDLGENITTALNDGWNLVGINANLTLQEIKDQIGDDNLLVIQGPEASNMYKKEYEDAGLSSLNHFTQFEDKKGYWVKVASSGDLTYIPTSKSLTINLNDGWNLINPPKELTLQEIKDQIGDENLLVIQGPEASNAYKKEYEDAGLSSLNHFIKFEEPKGYWIKISGSASLNF